MLINKIGKIVHLTMGYLFNENFFRNQMNEYSKREQLNLLKNLLLIQELKKINETVLIGKESDWSMHRGVQSLYNELFNSLYYNIKNKSQTKRTICELNKLSQGQCVLLISETGLSQRSIDKLLDNNIKTTTDLMSKGSSFIKNKNDLMKIKRYEEVFASNN